MNAHSPWAFNDVFFSEDGLDKDEFIIGDIVSLIVGGPDMVVISVCPQGCVEVAWADSDGDVCIDVFPEEALVYV